MNPHKNRLMRLFIFALLLFLGIGFVTPALMATLITSTEGDSNLYLPMLSQDNPTPTVTVTPIGPYIGAIPNCWTPGSPNSLVELFGGNWPTSPAPQSPISIYLRDRFGNTSAITTIPQGHGGSFSNITVNVSTFTPANSPYYFTAQAVNGAYAETMFQVPCTGSADLTISEPVLVSTPPIRAYEPVTFRYVITNTSNVNITDLFYVDTFFDPLGVTSTTVPLSYSVRHMAVNALAGGAVQVITLTVPQGFTGIATSHTVYGMVDSTQAITETMETNNIGGPLVVPVTPATTTPTPTSTPTGNGVIAGTVRLFNGSDWIPVFRAEVFIVQTTSVPTPTLVAIIETSMTGGYFFGGAIEGETYTIAACYVISGITYMGIRPGIVAPNHFVDLFLVPSTQACPFVSWP